MNKILNIIWASYFSLAPLAWLPIDWITPFFLYTLKLCLIGSGVVITWTQAFLGNRFRLPAGILGLSGLLIMFILCSPGFIQAESIGLAISRCTDIVLGFVVLWTIYIYVESGRDIMRPLCGAAIVVGILCFIAMMASFFEVLNFHAPSVFEGRSVTEIGFGGKRGNWSNGVALYLMPLLYWLNQKPKGLILRTVLGVCMVGIIGSQFLVSGRTGLLASLFLLFCTVFFVFKNYRYFIFLAGLLSILLIFTEMNIGNLFYDQFRLKNLERAGAGAATLETIDALSTGRVAQFSTTLALIGERPLVGYGFGKSVYGMDVHNLWLRLGFESGILFSIFFFFVALQIVRTGSTQSRYSYRVENQKSYIREHESNSLKLYKYTIYSGVLMSMLQPNVILGSFQVTAIWWVVAGILVQIDRGSRR